MTALLELRGVSKEFPVRSAFLRRRTSSTRAVDSVDLVLNRGETLGLVGESGSGKTTLGRIALGLIEPTAGQVLVDGIDLANLEVRERQAVRRRVQFVFQDPYSSLDPFTPVGDSIAEPLRTHHFGDRTSRPDRVAELLELVGLRPAFAQRYPREFSGGQLQRIAIARALALEPELVVLDEPVSSLDVSTQADVINLLAKLQAELGVAYLFIAHDLAVVDHISTRIAVMYLGRIVEEGPADVVVAKPKHPYTLALLSAVPGDEQRESDRRPRIVLQGELPSPRAKVAGCRFHTRCPLAMKVCRDATPDPILAPDGSSAWCHLHAPGKIAEIQSLVELRLPELQR